MSNIGPGHDSEPERSEGISTKACVIFVLVAGVVLFLVFFTWFQNTSNITPPPNNDGGDSPFSFSGSD